MVIYLLWYIGGIVLDAISPTASCRPFRKGLISFRHVIHRRKLVVSRTIQNSPGIHCPVVPPVTKSGHYRHVSQRAKRLGQTQRRTSRFPSLRTRCLRCTARVFHSFLLRRRKLHRLRPLLSRGGMTRKATCSHLCQDPVMKIAGLLALVFESHICVRFRGSACPLGFITRQCRSYNRSSLGLTRRRLSEATSNPGDSGSSSEDSFHSLGQPSPHGTNEATPTGSASESSASLSRSPSPADLPLGFTYPTVAIPLFFPFDLLGLTRPNEIGPYLGSAGEGYAGVELPTYTLGDPYPPPPYSVNPVNHLSETSTSVSLTSSETSLSIREFEPYGCGDSSDCITNRMPICVLLCSCIGMFLTVFYMILRFVFF